MHADDKILKATDFVEEHLKDDIEIDDIASASALSSRQLQRLFRNTLGLSVKQYLIGRRITEASYSLVDSNKRILDIGLEYQFQSPEVFSRAFQRFFKKSPSTFRDVGSLYAPQQRMAVNEDALYLLHHGLNEEPSLEKLPQRRILGVEHVMPFEGLPIDTNHELYEKTIEEVYNRLSPLKGTKPERIFVVGYRRRNHYISHHHQERFIGIEASEHTSCPDDMSELLLPNALYAKFKFQTPLDQNLSRFHCATFHSGRAMAWFINSGLSLNDAPYVSSSLLKAPYDFESCIPIAKEPLEELFWWKFLTEIKEE